MKVVIGQTGEKMNFLNFLFGCIYVVLQRIFPLESGMASFKYRKKTEESLQRTSKMEGYISIYALMC